MTSSWRCPVEYCSFPETKIDAILIDIAGVIHQSGEPIDGAVSAIEQLQAAGIPLRMLTNTTSKPQRTILAMLRGFGIQVDDDDVITAPSATINYLRKHQLRPYLIVAPSISDEFADFDNSSPNCVVLGDAGELFDYRNLNRAFRVLQGDRSAELIAMGGNLFFRDQDDKNSLDIYPFAALLAAASERDAVVTGKPAAQFFHSAIDSLRDRAESHVRTDQVVMIGDDLESDVGGAIEAGLQGVLVRTGKYAEGQLARSKVQPTAIYDDLAAAVEGLIST